MEWSPPNISGKLPLSTLCDTVSLSWLDTSTISSKLRNPF